jgi:hypothetical protein
MKYLFSILMLISLSAFGQNKKDIPNIYTLYVPNFAGTTTVGSVTDPKPKVDTIPSFFMLSMNPDSVSGDKRFAYSIIPFVKNGYRIHYRYDFTSDLRVILYLDLPEDQFLDKDFKPFSTRFIIWNVKDRQKFKF